ncbi:MAG: 16S rRNA (cytosine(967)-C(5))-methyltransferase RsmB [Filifactoraceae bacterium]
MKTARNLAYESVYNVKYKGAYSNIEINKALRENNLDFVDRGFYTELVYGTLENIIYLDYIIQKFSKLSLGKLSKSVTIILEMGLYQIINMNSVTNFAAVDESVKLCNKIDKRSSGFVNAVLRSILRSDKALEIIDLDEKESVRIKYSVSEYIFNRLVDIYGFKNTECILESFNSKPELYLRVNLNKVSREDLKGYLENMGVEVFFLENSKTALRVKRLKDIENNEFYNKGYFTVQDISSMIAVEVLDPQEEDRVLDICACPGGKTTYIGELMKNKGVIHGMDISENKLRLAAKSCKRLGIENVRFAVNDGTKHKNSLVEKYNKVLADVPCSGFGIIRRKPEIRYKKGEDVEQLPSIQRSILYNAASYVEKGGIVLYSTCTMDVKENQNIIRDFLEENTNFKLEKVEHPLIKSDKGEYGTQLLPNIDNCDGFFIAKIRRI